MRELHDSFGEPRGLARTTVQTMVERLVKKGFIERTEIDGVVVFLPRQDKPSVLRDAIAQFVETTLDGEIQPIASYLSNHRVSDEELEALREMLRTIEERRS